MQKEKSITLKMELDGFLPTARATVIAQKVNMDAYIVTAQILLYFDQIMLNTIELECILKCNLRKYQWLFVLGFIHLL